MKRLSVSALVLGVVLGACGGSDSSTVSMRTKNSSLDVTTTSSVLTPPITVQPTPSTRKIDPKFCIPNGWSTLPPGCPIPATTTTIAAADYAGQDLSGKDFRSANLTKKNFTGANLTGANFTGANLRRANLTGANLTDADLTRADLADANLTDANLTGANLTRADFTGAWVYLANLTGADLTDAKNVKKISKCVTSYFQQVCE